MRVVACLFILLGLAACKSAEKESRLVTQRETGSEIQGMPSWLRSKPMMSGYYVGVGAAKIMPGNQDHIRIAREMALNDLAGEIRVNISSSSMLHRFETNRSMQEQFLSQIRAQTQLEIEDYEQVDVYQSPTLYAVLYRLDRDAYQAKIRARKQSAMQRSWEAVQEARRAWEAGEIQNALYRYITAIQEVQDYLDQDLVYQYDMERVDLAGLIPSEMARMLGNISLSISPSHLQLSAGMQAESPLILQAMVKTPEGRIQPAKHLPLRWRVGNGNQEAAASGEKQTDAEGKARFRPPLLASAESVVITGEAAPSVWEFQIECPAFLKNYLMGFTKTSTARVSYQKPSIYLQADERVMDMPADYPHVTLTVKQFLENHGFVLTSGPEEADIIFDVKAHTEPGSKQGGIFIAYGFVKFTATRQSDGVVIYNGLLERLKGADLSYEAAGRRAFSSNKDEISKQLERFLAR